MAAGVSSQWKPYSSGPPECGVYQNGAAANSRYPAAAATRCLSRTSTASAGSTHTQWCAQEIGETSSPVVPVTAVAPSQSCRRARTAATVSPIAANTTETITHQAPMCPCPPAIRTAAAYGDWLLM